MSFARVSLLTLYSSPSIAQSLVSYRGGADLQSSELRSYD